MSQVFFVFLHDVFFAERILNMVGFEKVFQFEYVICLVSILHINFQMSRFIVFSRVVNTVFFVEYVSCFFWQKGLYTCGLTQSRGDLSCLRDAITFRER